MKHDFFASDFGRNGPSQNDLPIAFISTLKYIVSDSLLLGAHSFCRIILGEILPLWVVHSEGNDVVPIFRGPLFLCHGWDAEPSSGRRDF